MTSFAYCLIGVVALSAFLRFGLLLRCTSRTGRPKLFALFLRGLSGWSMKLVSVVALRLVVLNPISLQKSVNGSSRCGSYLRGYFLLWCFLDYGLFLKYTCCLSLTLLDSSESWSKFSILITLVEDMLRTLWGYISIPISSGSWIRLDDWLAVSASPLLELYTCEPPWFWLSVVMSFWTTMNSWGMPSLL